jgi:hypothetical protein
MVKFRDAASASSLVMVGESIENFSVGAAMVRRLLQAFELTITFPSAGLAWLAPDTLLQALNIG